MITSFKIFEYVKITEKPSFKKWFRKSKESPLSCR